MDNKIQIWGFIGQIDRQLQSLMKIKKVRSNILFMNIFYIEAKFYSTYIRVDKLIDRQAKRKMDGVTNSRYINQMDRYKQQIYIQIDRQICRQIDIWKDRLIDKQIDRYIGTYIDRFMDRYMDKQIDR